MPITGSQCSDRHEVKPFALFGGQEGGNGGTLIQKAGSDEWLTVRELYGKVSSSKYANVRFEPGDRIRLWTPGGGGYGDPRERDPAPDRGGPARGLRLAGQRAAATTATGPPAAPERASISALGCPAPRL